MIKDRGLKRELEQAGLPSAGEAPFMLPGETARDIGVPCLDCGKRNVVYFISKPMGTLIPVGAYCYRHLLARCKAARMIPYPIEAALLDKLQADIRIKPGDRKIIIDLGGKND